MLDFIAKRLGSLVLTMLIVSIAVFLITEAAPGDVAKHILGREAQPEQVALFRKQLGLDQPLHIRYLTWLIGSDWRARWRIGRPLRRVRDAETGDFEWWVQWEDNSLRRWTMEEDNLITHQLTESGDVKTYPAADVWQIGPEGREVFWGVDTSNRAVLWQQGVSEEARASTVGRAQLEYSGGIKYIPLMRGILRGDPGVSIHTLEPVGHTLSRRLKNSAVLAGVAFLVVMPLAVALGLLAGVNEGGVLDDVLSLFGLFTTSSPNFATGIFLILIFAIWLQWLPGATVFMSSTAIFEEPAMLVLPVLTLTLIELGYVLRITRASVIEVMETEYIRTAILKGIPYRKVVVRHALRNALLAPITVIMLHVNWLMGGIVVVEAIFGFPGLGTYLLNSAMVKDIYAVEAGAMVMVTLAVGTQLVADVIYTLLNPRIRYD